MAHSLAIGNESISDSSPSSLAPAYDAFGANWRAYCPTGDADDDVPPYNGQDLPEAFPSSLRKVS